MRRMLNLVFIPVLALSGVLAAADCLAPDTAASGHRSQVRIVGEVRHELVMIPQLSIFDNLAYRIDGNTVTLLGQVRNPIIKDEAQAAVNHIEGVRQVNNQIEVLPVSINDDRIRRQVARTVFNDPRLFEYAIQSVPPIHIIVKNGNVRLEGVVRDQGDKDVAGIRANGVPGVFSVANNLQVENHRQSKG